MTHNLQPLFVMKNPLHCNTIVDTFLNVNQENVNQETRYNLHVLDGDFNSIRLTINYNGVKDLFSHNIITVHHRDRKNKVAKWQRVGFIECNDKILAFNMPVNEIKKQHNTILYICSQIYWTLSHFDNNIPQDLHVYQMKTGNCPFCNHHIKIRSIYKGCDKCCHIWRMM